MPAPEKFYNQLKERLRGETNRNIQDQLLDLWLATEQQATEYDAKEWGFDPDKWMNEERYMLSQRVDRASTVRKSLPE